MKGNTTVVKEKRKILGRGEIKTGAENCRLDSL